MGEFSKMELQWEVCCGDLGNTITHYFCTSSEVLDFCGQIFYANFDFLFDVVTLDIRYMDSMADDFPEEYYTAKYGDEYLWRLLSRSEEGPISCRLLETTHDLFGMLIAEIKRGATRVHIYNLKAV